MFGIKPSTVSYFLMHANIVGFMIGVLSYIYIHPTQEIIFVIILNVVCAILAYMNAQNEKEWE